MDQQDENTILAYEFLQAIYTTTNGIHLPNKSFPKNVGEIALLGALDTHGGSMTSGELSQLLDFKTARIASLLRVLEFKGQISRHHAKEDKRVIIVSLTPKGKKICDDSIDCIVSKIAYAYKKIGKDEMNQFKNTLIKLLALRKEETNHA